MLAAMGSAGVDRLDAAERTLLWVPWLGGLVFGLGPLLAPAAVASLTGYSNDDEYIGRLAGAATLGYAVALWPALRGEWSRGVQSIVAAVLIFNLTSVMACGEELLTGRSRPLVLLILITSIAIVAITGWLLARRRLPWPNASDIPTWVTGVIVMAVLAAAFFGIAPQFAGRFASSNPHSTRPSGPRSARSRMDSYHRWPFLG